MDPPTNPSTIDSSPRAAAAAPPQNDGVVAAVPDHPLPPVPNAKLRLMCSYGGHIMPRPHDKTLTYVGGDTRLVVVDRNSCLFSLSSRLSRTLLNGRHFTLKYQLPSEDLDSLVTVTTDEDLENMIEEYDRVSSSLTSATGQNRIRLFLFVSKLETAATMGSLLDDAKSETWFVDALNGSGLLPRGLSDSAAVVDSCLVNLDDVAGSGGSDHQLIRETKVNGAGGGGNGGERDNNNKLVDTLQLSALPDSPMMVETGTSSSYGSSSSTPSMANLPPIRVRVGEEPQRTMAMTAVEEQFAQMSFSNDLATSRPQPPMMPAAMADAVAVAAINNTVVDGGGGGGGRVMSDDERSDPGMAVGYRKPPLPLQPVVVAPRGVGGCGGYSLASPDSVASDSSIQSATSFTKPMYYQDQAQAQSRAPTMQPDTNPMSSSQVPVQKVPSSGYTTTTTLDQYQMQVQQPYVHAGGVQYIPHPAGASVTSYYPVYTHPIDHQHQHQHHHHQQQQQQQQQYPVYVMPVAQSHQQYMSMQSNNADASIAAPNRPLTAPTPTVIATSAGYKDGTPPLYPSAKPAVSTKPEIPPNMYRTAVASNPQVVQIPANQFQPQYVGYSQVPSHASHANYGYEYTNPPNEQAYYAALPMPSQYQSMTPAAAATALADASKQLAVEANKPQITASQPL